MKDIVKKLDRAFNPRSVAVVGDKREMDYMWLKSLANFQGNVYSVQIDEQELPGIEALGVENHYSLLDIAEPIDYVIIAVPRAVAPKIVRDCIEKGVGAAMLFTSGFAETGTEEGIRLQNVIAEMARKADFNLIGPNCVGIFNPRIGLRNAVEQEYGDGGPVGFISQSGTHATLFSLVGALNGVRVSKSVSYGNAVVLDSSDYLDYLAEDPGTEVIGMYIEGVRNGRQFFTSLRAAAERKPVVIWKGGITEEGTRATASHTASLAESPLVWDAMIKQCGVIRADSLDEMVDTVKALLYLKPTTGLKVGLVAISGGQSVVITDAFAKEGLEVPLLTEKSYREFAAFFNIIGSSYRNPLDISSNFRSMDNIIRCIDILNEDDNIDSVVLELSIAFMTRIFHYTPSFLVKLLDALAQYKERSDKPFITIVSAGAAERQALEARAKLVEKNIPSFPDFARGARTLRRVVEYHRARSLQVLPR